ncbi:hypothetical protein BS47DRAFT_1356897 [Hydnum rufescens UP504]|uniref:Uncharacterized protein n=1 Tax=Hydnum rufescens UP504 TaxID=1448309 RepID=A0A9P6DDN0_9AGAM|nr:hypothetical protein BS47DRAFT_1356897 [Hydnum rufescens UP504]
MKLAHSLALLVMAALTMPSALADFHILRGVQTNTGYSYDVACPSDYYYCDCFMHASRGAGITMVGGGLSYGFSTQGNLCGMGQLDFRLQNDGHWEFYVHNGDGSLQGTCSSNIGSILNCPHSPDDYFFYEQLLCSSYICNP